MTYTKAFNFLSMTTMFDNFYLFVSKMLNRFLKFNYLIVYDVNSVSVIS